MRVGSLRNRAVIVTDDGAIDIAEASDGRFPAATRELLERWDEFRRWADDASLPAAVPFDEDDLDAPVADPTQVFAIGLNYTDHADEAGLPHPEHLVVFTKFPSAIGAPNAAVTLPSDDVDYETELVVVIGHGGHDIPESEAWSHVAGLCIGQDYSERVVQRRRPAAQFSLGKSYPNFAPYGPTIVTADELPDPNALRISAVLEGEGLDTPLTVQDGTTADLIFPVARIIAELSEIITFRPGDLIFTGTPAGVGLSRNLMMRPGQILSSTLEGVGTIRNEFV